MARNDTTNAAKVSAQQAMVTAMLTFVTATLPPLHAAAVTAINAFDPTHPTLATMATEDMAFYRDCVEYTNELIAKGRYAGPPLRFP